MKRFMIIGVLLLLAACGGGSIETTTSTGDTGASAGVNVDTDGADVNVQADAGVNADASSMLREILGGATKLKYKATYDMTSAGVSMSFTQAFDLPKYAITTIAAGTEARIIFDGTSVVTCTKSDGWTCFKTSGAATAQKDVQADVKANLDLAGTTVEAAGTCSRAGETGKKFRMTTSGATTTICYTSDGILLEMMANTGGQSVSMTATSVSRSVASSEFVPPAEPQEFDAGAYGGYRG